MIDLDRVVFDCKSIPYAFANRFFTVSSINRQLKYQIVDTELAKQYKNHLSFFRFCNKNHLIALDHAVKTLKKWNNQGFNINFVSCRPNLKSLKKLTADWLEEQDLKYNSLIFCCTNKPRFCHHNNIDIIIDDTLTNCINSTMFNINAIWVTKRPEEIKKLDIDIPLYTANNWQSIDNIVQKVYKNNITKYNEESLSL